MPCAPKRLPSAELLHSMFHLTDDFRLINKTSRKARRAGSFADAHDRAGYRSVFVEGRLQFAHRIIWVMTFGNEPDGYLDHINGDILDNRPSNLREVTHVQNMFNRKKPKHNTSGVKGIHKRKDNGMWRAYISFEGRRTNIGQFPSREEAQAALDEVREELHGEFARAA